MNWYLSKIVYRIVCGDGNHTAQFDEQLRLIEAEDEQLALNKARTVGRKEEDSFMNDKKVPVKWQFIDVAELYKISALIDGAELYSRIHESENADGYISLVQRKANDIQSASIHRCLELL